tara:strand:- start:13 stop:1053 length:1041 start_codon:yes stop_codon:yes gene_type:complete
MDTLEKPHYFESLKNSVVANDDGIIRAASLMSKGEAQGHFDDKGRQIMVDDVTLEQIFKTCKKLGAIKVKADHGSGVMSTVGWADNFSLTSDKVTADVHLYDTEPQRDRLLEIADKNPTHMGISMEFNGKDKPSGKVCLSRCSEVFCAAIVSDPAANKSLFQIPEKDDAEQEPENQTNTTMEPNEENEEPTISDLMAKFEELGTRLTALETPSDSDSDDTELEDPEVEIKATDPTDKPEDSDPTKTYEDGDKPEDEDEEKKIELAAKRGAEMAIKAFSAKLGITKLGKSGAVNDSKPTTKHFAEFVADEATANHDGDQAKATAHILSNKSRYGDAWKAYEAQRNVT